MYLGNQPALSYTSFAKQDFTTSATTSYTLDNPVANANELALFINFVRQEPTTAYSASGTTLTLTSATSATDDMYCVFLGKAVQTVNPPNASVGLSQLTATGTKDSTTFLRGDNTFASAGGDNTPAFYVHKNATQTISNSTHTELTWQTEVLDTDNNFASNRFTPTTAGYYQISLSVRMDSNDTETQLWIKKNTTQYTLYDEVNEQWQMNGSRIFYANGTGDYFTAGVWQGSGSDKTVNSSDVHTAFQGFKIIT